MERKKGLSTAENTLNQIDGIKQWLKRRKTLEKMIKKHQVDNQKITQKHLM
jgi:hypothetical protein